MAHDYLIDLNQEQRRAVKHGVKDGSALNSRPLLVIAGAGSGKTKTLAHRVAHLGTSVYPTFSLNECGKRFGAFVLYSIAYRTTRDHAPRSSKASGDGNYK